MPSVNGHGYSPDWTPEKQRIFRKFIPMHLQMAEGAMRKHNRNPRYYYFDLNAGCGVNPETGEDGSPLIFVQEAERTTIEYNAYMIEKSEQNFKDLELRLNKTRAFRAAAINADHNEYMRDFLQNFYKYKFGLFYADPNAVNDMPFDLLADLSIYWQKADILIAISGTSVKRDRCAHDKPFLIDRLNQIKKKNRMIRKPFSKFQWTFIYMTNGPMPDWKREHFYSFNSQQGREYLAQVNLTKNENSNQIQPALFNL